MPHLTLEYSANVYEKPQPKAFFLPLHKILEPLGPFAIKNFKSRIVSHREFFLADGANDQGFVHLEIAILPGRSEELRDKLANQTLEYLTEYFPKTAKERHCSFSVEVRELSSHSYKKVQTEPEVRFSEES